MMDVQEIILKIKDVIRKIEPDAKVILYGSYARGEQTESSDIDVLVLLPDSYEGKEYVRKRFSISDHLYDLSLDLGIEISPLVVVNKVFYSCKTPFTVNIANEGIEL